MLTYITAALVNAGLAWTQTVPVLGPCDYYQNGGTPCVAAHSTTRSLFGAYSGPLYQVKRGNDSQTAQIFPIAAGGIANAATQNAFCHLTVCVITIIYDQSGNNNHLAQGPPGGGAKGPNTGHYDFGANPVGARVLLGGEQVYGVFGTYGTGYRNDTAIKTATGNSSEGIYAVLDGTHYDAHCCYDYGNAERNNMDDGQGTMEALHFGNKTYGHPGAGPGPWIGADLEDGIFMGTQPYNPQNPTIKFNFLTGILKGGANLWSLRGGSAQAGALSTYYNGTRPNGNFTRPNKSGAIILGIGGDNSDWGAGTFYEGVMTSGYPTDELESLVQANIVAAKYTQSIQYGGQLPTIGSQVSLQAVGSMLYVGHSGRNVTMMSISSTSSTSQKQAATFIVRPGNNGPCLSLEAVDAPGSFLRQRNYTIYADAPNDTFVNPHPPPGDYDQNENFPDSSTFCPEPGFTGSGTAFRSWYLPTRYIRAVTNDTVWIGTQGGPFSIDTVAGFSGQASFFVRPGLS